MSDKLLNDLSSSHQGGGSPDKLNDKRISGKLQKYWGEHEASAGKDNSVERMKARNTALRLAKSVPPREKGANRG